MNKEEAKTILRTIRAYYSSFLKDENKEEAQIWMRKLMKGNFNMTMKKLEIYVEKEEFPPKIANILSKEHVNVAGDPELIESMKKVQQEKTNPETSRIREEKLRKLHSLLERGEVNE